MEVDGIDSTVEKPSSIQNDTIENAPVTKNLSNFSENKDYDSISNDIGNSNDLQGFQHQNIPPPNGEQEPFDRISPDRDQIHEPVHNVNAETHLESNLNIIENQNNENLERDNQLMETESIEPAEPTSNIPQIEPSNEILEPSSSYDSEKPLLECDEPEPMDCSTDLSADTQHTVQSDDNGPSKPSTEIESESTECGTEQLPSSHDIDEPLCENKVPEGTSDKENSSPILNEVQDKHKEELGLQEQNIENCEPSCEPSKTDSTPEESSSIITEPIAKSDTKICLSTTKQKSIAVEASKEHQNDQNILPQEESTNLIDDKTTNTCVTDDKTTNTSSSETTGEQQKESLEESQKETDKTTKEKETNSTHDAMDTDAEKISSEKETISDVCSGTGCSKNDEGMGCSKDNKSMECSKDNEVTECSKNIEGVLPASNDPEQTKESTETTSKAINCEPSGGQESETSKETSEESEKNNESMECSTNVEGSVESSTNDKNIEFAHVNFESHENEKDSDKPAASNSKGTDMDPIASSESDALESIDNGRGADEEITIIPDSEREITEAEKEAASSLPTLKDISDKTKLPDSASQDGDIADSEIKIYKYEKEERQQCCECKEEKSTGYHFATSNQEVRYICDDNCLGIFKSVTTKKITMVTDEAVASG